VQEAGAFQSLIDRIAAMETELQSFKLAQLSIKLRISYMSIQISFSEIAKQDLRDIWLSRSLSW
jgi:hypothetical protein